MPASIPSIVFIWPVWRHPFSLFRFFFFLVVHKNFWSFTFVSVKLCFC